MTANAAITLGLTIAGFCVTILTIVIKQATKDGKRDQRVDTIEEETNKNRDKIRALYEQVNEHGSSIKVIESEIGTVKETTERIENKLDRIIETRGTI